MANEQRKHHASLYLADGDIVLFAPKPDGAIQVFRVDQAYLSRNSPVFKTMFMLPSSGNQGKDGNNVNEMYEGAPLVWLSDDASDLESLLNFLYYRLPPLKEHLSPLNYGVYKGILNLAVKYEMDDLKALVSKQIEADWPTTYMEWCLQGAATVERRRLSLKPHPWPFPDWKDVQDVPNPVCAISLAIEFNIPSILPTTFYKLATTSTSQAYQPSNQHAI